MSFFSPQRRTHTNSANATLVGASDCHKPIVLYRANHPRRIVYKAVLHRVLPDYASSNSKSAVPSLRLPGDGLAGYDYWLRRSDLVLTIRLARIGKKKKPFYRVVVIERTRPRNGRVKELVGTYDPLKKPAEIKLDSEGIKYWRGVGAQPSDTVRSFLKLQKIA